MINPKLWHLVYDLISVIKYVSFYKKNWLFQTIPLYIILGGSEHGWGTQKDCFILYSLDPPFHLNILLKLNDTFILKVWFCS